MTITYTKVGNVGQEDILLYEIGNGRIQAKILNAGGSIAHLYVPDKNGNIDDIVLGHKSYEDYVDNRRYQGCLVGRFANRIAQAQFYLHGTRYVLSCNNGPNSLHGGSRGYTHRIWQADLTRCNDSTLTLMLESPSGEEGYPANLHVEVVYRITAYDALSITYMAVGDADTFVNLMNHVGFNLDGHGAGSVLDHLLMINADYYTPFDSALIPTGEIRFTRGTPLDFTREKAIGRDIGADFDQLVYGNHGYDASLILRGRGMQHAATLRSPVSGRQMDTYTTSPTVLLYTGNNFDGQFIGKDNIHYVKHGGICLETQLYPNSMNQNTFPYPLLRAGDVFRHTTEYRFSW